MYGNAKFYEPSLSTCHQRLASEVVDASSASDGASFERRAVAVLKSLFAVAALLSFRNLFEDGVRTAVVEGGTVGGVRACLDLLGG